MEIYGITLKVHVRRMRESLHHVPFFLKGKKVKVLGWIFVVSFLQARTMVCWELLIAVIVGLLSSKVQGFEKTIYRTYTNTYSSKSSLFNVGFELHVDFFQNICHLTMKTIILQVPPNYPPEKKVHPKEIFYDRITAEKNRKRSCSTKKKGGSLRGWPRF